MLSRLVLIPFLVVTLSTACSKMDPQECTKLRDGAFELINTANVCTSDADCKPSDWPGCAKPIIAQNLEKIHAMKDTFSKGKCEEKPAACNPSPVVYCQEGLCAFRYKPFQGEGMKIE